MATATNYTSTQAFPQPASDTNSPPPCAHCGGRLRPDFWDGDILTCCQCARQVFPFDPQAKRKRRGPKSLVDWTPQMVDRLLSLYQDQSLSICDIAQMMGLSEGSVRNKVRHLRRDGVHVPRKIPGLKPQQAA